MTAWIAVFALLAYGYGLGAGAVVVWRYYRGWVRYLPGLATLVYYLLAWMYPHPAARAVLDGQDYPLTDAARTVAAALAFGLSLFLITRLLKKEDKT